MTILRLLVLTGMVGICLGLSVSSLGPMSGFVGAAVLFFFFLTIDISERKLNVIRHGSKILVCFAFCLVVPTLSALAFCFCRTLWTRPDSGVWKFSPLNAGLFCAIVCFVESLVLLIPSLALVLFLSRRRNGDRECRDKTGLE